METTADAARAWSGATIGELCAGRMDGLAASHRPPVDSASAEPTIARPSRRGRAQLSGIFMGASGWEGGGRPEKGRKNGTYFVEPLLSLLLIRKP